VQQGALAVVAATIIRYPLPKRGPEHVAVVDVTRLVPPPLQTPPDAPPRTVDPGREEPWSGDKDGSGVTQRNKDDNFSLPPPADGS
jgi:hypothetical protein